MDQTKLKVWVEQTVKNGPTRVVINLSGEATTPERAERDYQVKPDIIYIRNDGWSLGCPAYLDNVTSNMWKDEWVAVTWKDSHAWQWRSWGGNEPAREVGA